MNRTFIVVDDDEVNDSESDSTLCGDLGEDLTTDDEFNHGSRRAPARQAFFEIPSNHKLIRSFQWQGSTLGCGVVVELIPDERSKIPFEFLEIHAIYQGQEHDKIILRGTRYRRFSHCHGMQRPWRNEVSMLMKYNKEDPRSIHEQSLETRELEDILPVVRQLTHTNRDFPAYSCHEQGWPDNQSTSELGPLVCRWVFEITYDTFEDTRERRRPSTAWLRLRRETSDPGKETSDHAKRVHFRQHEKIVLDLSSLIDLTADSLDEKPLVARPPARTMTTPHFQRRNRGSRGRIQSPADTKYRFGDGFCGAGGVSSGARAAGLRPVWALDWDNFSCQTYQRNFPSVKIYRQEIFDFLTKHNNDVCLVDVLHISPPCPYWSPAKRMPGKNDDANLASLFSVHGLIPILRPRVITLEQTAGLLTHHRDFFHRLIEQFTAHGYSVRWRVLKMGDFEVCQKERKRLIIIASCPGEPLPPFPETTHGPGKRSHITIAQALSTIPIGQYDHDPWKYPIEPGKAYDPHTRLDCVMASARPYHPSGRKMTDAEVKVCQGFPPDHKFVGGSTEVMKQMGNAVPPPFAKLMMEKVIETLKATDRAEAGQASLFERGNNNTSPIDLSD